MGDDGLTTEIFSEKKTTRYTVDLVNTINNKVVQVVVILSL